MRIAYKRPAVCMSTVRRQLTWRDKSQQRRSPAARRRRTPALITGRLRRRSIYRDPDRKPIILTFHQTSPVLHPLSLLWEVVLSLSLTLWRLYPVIYTLVMTWNEYFVEERYNTEILIDVTETIKTWLIAKNQINQVHWLAVKQPQWLSEDTWMCRCENKHLTKTTQKQHDDNIIALIYVNCYQWSGQVWTARHAYMHDRRH